MKEKQVLYWDETDQGVIASWSGGKDSCLACYKAMRRGYKIKNLVNFISREHQRCCFHGIEAKLMRLQAERVGIPLVQKAVTADMAEYEKEFKEAVAGIAGVKAMVFGDIYLNEHKDWVERVCRDLNIQWLEPLWDEKPENLVREFIDLGFKAVVVSCQADKFDENFVGRAVDLALLAELKEKNVCLCGENGEFHTLVIDGPMFKQPIEILESRPVLKQGFWPHWFLDIKKYR